jgi:hypothetical protein
MNAATPTAGPARAPETAMTHSILIVEDEVDLARAPSAGS